MNTFEITDENLMIDAKAGNIEAIGILYNRYSKKLYNFFFRYTGKTDISSDLLQSLFLRVIKYKNSYNSHFHFKTWIYQMARNLLKDQYEEKVKHQVEMLNHSILTNYAEEDQVNQQAQDHLLFKAIERLSGESRELIVMSKFQGLKYEEISEITGDSVANIKVKVHRTLIKLKEIYFEMEKLYN